MKQTNGRRIALSVALVAALSSQALAAKAGQVAPTEPDKPSITEKQIRALLTKRRAQQIERLRAYRIRGVFPSNTYSRTATLRVLQDAKGTLCAVANLIALDGLRALVDKTTKSNRFVIFSSLKKGALYDWIFTSGFTQEELAAIQLPDRPMRSERWWRAQEQRRLRAHLLQMEKKLIRDAKASISTMVERLQKRPELLGALLRASSKG